MAALGEVLPNYEIGDELGRGAFGVVHAGRHRGLGRAVAIKQLVAPPRSDPAIRERFLSEARLLASFDHPHVVPLYDFVETDGLCLLVMECLTGGTIESRQAELTPAAACAAVAGACAGLHYAHAKGVLHRDVKPANLMFSADGVLKVTDFGIAKLFGGAAAALTATGSVLGTPNYMAPEQVTGEALGPFTDVYATAVVLYELLAGASPFPPSDDPMTALFHRIRTDPIPLLERAPDAPAALAAVTGRALQRDPERRYASALELGAAILDAASREWGPDWMAQTGLVLRDEAVARARPPADAAPESEPRAPLLERDGDVVELAQTLDRACAGEGGLVVITAAPGMGKTRLAQEAADLARGRYMRTLSARAEQLEREFPFGVVRRLFEPLLMRIEPSARAGLLAGAAAPAGELLLGGHGDAPPMGEAAVNHALYWLVANLATSRPLALVVDDAHWADRPSLRALLHLVLRLEGLPVAVVVAARPSEPDAEQDVLDRLAEDPLACHLRLEALSETAVAGLLADRLPAPEPEFARACHAASAGNPFLVSELASALGDAGTEPTAANAHLVGAVGPRTVARNVLARLRGQPPEVAALARALAILGGHASLAHVARTAGLDEQAAGRAADALADINVFSSGRPLAFAHPIVRAAVYDSLGGRERSAGHLAAPRMLPARGEAPGAIAAHLLHAEPAGDAWVVERLREAETAATSVGALGSTVAYVGRALAEPPPPALHAELLIALSEGQRHRNEWEGAAAALREAIAEAGEPSVRVKAARRLSTLLLVARRHDQAAAELEPVIAALRKDDPAGAAELELSLSASLWLDTDRAPELAARMRALPVPGGGADRRERVILSRQAWAALVAGEPAPLVGRLAQAALSSGELIAEDARAHGFEMSVLALALTDRFADAHAHLVAAMGAARSSGHLGRWGFLSAAMAHVLLLEGRLHDAEQHALEAIDVLRPDGIAFPAALDALTDALLERGQLAAARHVREHLADRCELPDPLLFAGLRLTEARVLVAEGDLPSALDRSLSAGRRQLELARPNPAWCPWRSTAALVQLELGWLDAAVALADEELELARRFGASRALGVALRVAGLCRGGDARVQLLAEAVTALDRAGAVLEHARALVDLGA